MSTTIILNVMSLNAYLRQFFYYHVYVPASTFFISFSKQKIFQSPSIPICLLIPFQYQFLTDSQLCYEPNKKKSNCSTLIYLHHFLCSFPENYTKGSIPRCHRILCASSALEYSIQTIPDRTLKRRIL